MSFFSPEELRAIVRWAALCARRAIAVYEEAIPADARVRDAIREAQLFADTGDRTARLREVAWAALAAAREAGDQGAAAAARSASAAAGAAFLHPVASFHQLNHIYGAAAHAATALGEIDWPEAPPEVRAVVRRYPAFEARKDRFGRLLMRMDAEFRR